MLKRGRLMTSHAFWEKSGTVRFAAGTRDNKYICPASRLYPIISKFRSESERVVQSSWGREITMEARGGFSIRDSSIDLGQENGERMCTSLSFCLVTAPAIEALGMFRYPPKQEAPYARSLGRVDMH
jgi:hypothetical protein